MQSRRIPQSGALVAALAMLVLGGTPAGAEYLALSVTEKHGTLPLPEDLTPIAQNRPTDLLQFQWSDFSGKRARIRVLTTENKSGLGARSATTTVTGPDGQRTTWSYDVNSDYNEVPVQGLDAMMTDILLQTGRFDVVERESLDAILQEQDLADTGRVSAPSAAKKGKVLGAQLGVKLVVNAYEPNISGGKRGLGGIGRMIGGRAGLIAGKVKWEKAESRVGITVQLIDMETAQIIDSSQVDVRLKMRKFGIGGVGWGTSAALGGFLSNYSQTPIGQAMIAAVNVGVYDIIKGVGSQPAEGVVADVSDGKVMVTMGEGQVFSGDIIRAVGLGKEIYHPETGVLLSREEEELGRLRITETRDTFSFAVPIEGAAADRMKVGDKVVSTREPEAYEYGQPWN
jgi:curli biogenesis system outer membrane secretion channel CsgG